MNGLDARMLLARYRDDPDYRNLVAKLHRGLLADRGDKANNRLPDGSDEQIDVDPSAYMRNIMSTISAGLFSRTAHVVSNEIVEVLKVAAQSLPETVTLSREDLPQDSGIVLLDSSEPHHLEMPMRGFIWSLTAGSRSVVVIPVIELKIPERKFELWPMYPREIALEHSMPSAIFVNATNFIIAFFIFLRQSLVEQVESVVPRAVRRREGAGRPMQHIVRAQLRRVHRSKGARPDETDIEWSHRWLVSGHWRNQWYSKNQTHRLKWIAAHVKGPDDMPLVVKDRIVRVDR